jgi:DNA polymerase-3 subunit gamma/tau
MPPSSSPAAPVDRPLSPGALDVTELRRHWPRILDDLKQRRKFVWMTLSQFAQVTDLIGHVLWLTFAEPGARDNFGRSGGEETLRAVIVDLLGANLVIRGRIETDPPPRAEVVTVVSGVGPGGVAPGVDLVPGEAGLEPINAVPAGAGPRVGAADAGPDSTANWASPAAARPSIGPTEAPTHSERAERHLRVVTPAASPATPAPREQSDRGTARRRGEPGVLSSHERVDRDRSLADDSVDEGVAPDDDIIPTEAIGQAAEDLVKEVFRAEFVKAEEGPPRRPGN